MLLKDNNGNTDIVLDEYDFYNIIREKLGTDYEDYIKDNLDYREDILKLQQEFDSLNDTNRDLEETVRDLEQQLDGKDELVDGFRDKLKDVYTMIDLIKINLENLKLKLNENLDIKELSTELEKIIEDCCSY